MVCRGCRRAQREDRGGRGPLGSAGEAHDRRARSLRGPGLHRPARTVGVQRARRQADGLEDRAQASRRKSRAREPRSPRSTTPCSPRPPTSTSATGSLPTFARSTGSSRPSSAAGSAVNMATFVGAGTIRDFVIGKADRRATPEELARMCDIVDQAMKEGALGVSSSLQYVPDVQLDRRVDRDGEGRGAIRRRVLHASAPRPTPSTPPSTRSSASARKRRFAPRSGT